MATLFNMNVNIPYDMKMSRVFVDLRLLAESGSRTKSIILENKDTEKPIVHIATVENHYAHKFKELLSFVGLVSQRGWKISISGRSFAVGGLPSASR